MIKSFTSIAPGMLLQPILVLFNLLNLFYSVFVVVIVFFLHGFGRGAGHLFSFLYYLVSSIPWFWTCLQKKFLLSKLVYNSNYKMHSSYKENKYYLTNFPKVLPATTGGGGGNHHPSWIIFNGWFYCYLWYHLININSTL